MEATGLPPDCRRIPADEVTHIAEARAKKDFTEPYFAVYDDAFLDILGESPSIKLEIEKGYAFAHEAGVFLPDQDAVYITSNRLTTADGGQEIHVGKLSRSPDGRWQYERLETEIAMGNGGINYSTTGVLFCDQGTKTVPGGLVWMDARPPYTTTSVIQCFHARLFSSVNDVVTHTDGSIWFTDPIYGFEQGFRNEPQLPSQVYRFKPGSGDIRPVADGFGRPNGLCFSPDESTMYITDTDWIHGDGTTDGRRVSHIYAFDVIEKSSAHFLVNRRLFAMADEGVPDGIKCDTQGNVYSGCGDGVSAWSAGGTLLGKIKIPGGVANFCFGNKGEMFLLNETRFYTVNISKLVHGALLANMGIVV